VGVGTTPLNLLAADQPDAARRWNDQHIARWPYQGFSLQHLMAVESSAFILIYEGRFEEALDVLEKARGPLRRMLALPHPVVQGYFNSIVARGHLGLAAAGRDRHRHLGAARAIGRRIRKLPIAWGEAVGVGILACAAWISGDREQGMRLMEQAIQHLEALGMDMDANSARLRLAGWMGTSGQRHLTQAEEYMARERIANPNAIARLWIM
jgi:hypothetical protein